MRKRVDNSCSIYLRAKKWVFIYADGHACYAFASRSREHSLSTYSALSLGEALCCARLPNNQLHSTLKGIATHLALHQQRCPQVRVPMTNYAHGLIYIDEIKFVCSQKSSRHLQDIRVGKILAYACSLTNTERNNKLLDVLSSRVVKSVWVVFAVVFTPEVGIVVEGVDVERHLRLR